MMPPDAAREPYAGQSYYGRPALKAPHWDWTVSGYIFLAGLGGSAQAIAWIGSRRDPRGFRGALGNARLLALASAGVGGALLVADLKTPGRFYNMLRILRPTSPMSFGSYLFGAFGASSLFAALGELPAAGRRPVLRRAAGLAQPVAAVAGAGAATYTAALLAATSNPHWAAAPRALGAGFAASAVASGAAALAVGERLGGRHQTARRLEGLAALATLARLAARRAGERRRQAAGLAPAPATSAAARTLQEAERPLAGLLPLAAYAVGRRRSPALAVAGSLALLAGGLLARHAVLAAGRSAADRPESYFRLAQPGRRTRSVGLQRERR